MTTLAAPFDIPMKAGAEIRIAQAAVKIYRGSAVAVVSGTGYATALVPATDAHRFIGIAEETVDNSAGSAGNLYIRVARSGVFAFNMSGIVQASVGAKVWFSDDNTVTTTPGQVLAGTVVTIDQANALCWVDIGRVGVTSGNPSGLVAVAASGAIAPRTSASYVITKAGVAAMTLAAPTAGTDDGVEIFVTSGTANAHTITTVNLLKTGSANVAIATFAASIGAGVWLVAYNGFWHVKSQIGITFS